MRFPWIFFALATWKDSQTQISYGQETVREILAAISYEQETTREILAVSDAQQVRMKDSLVVHLILVNVIVVVQEIAKGCAEVIDGLKYSWRI